MESEEDMVYSIETIASIVAPIAEKHGIPVRHVHSASVSALKKLLEQYGASS